MRSLTKIMGIALLAQTFAFVAQAQTVTLNLGHALPAQSSYQVAAEKFAELIKARSDGRIEVKVFPHGGLGGELKLIQGTRTGVVDMMFIGQPSLENTVREYRVLSLPYLFDNYEQANTVLQGPMGQTLLDVLPKYGMVGLSWGAIYERSVLTLKKPIRMPSDFNGTKLRVIQSSGYVAVYEALGA